MIYLKSPGENYEEPDFNNFNTDFIVVPLHRKIYLESVIAKQLALQVLKNESIFKHHITSLGLMDSDLKNTILLAKMPKFIWCAEIYNTTNYGAKEKEAIGLILLYATEANQESINALIFAGYLIGASV